MASKFTGQELYEHQRSIGVVYGVELKPWEELSWDEQIEWDERAHEQNTKED